MALRDTIIRVANEEGIDPAYALAVAERESSFNPRAGGTGTIKGLYQMSGALRRKYGIADDASAEDQTRGFARFTHDLRRDMAQHLGRDPSGQETYLGHYWGGPRAARILAAGQDLSPADVFTPREFAGNPEFSRHGSMGSLAQSVMGDMTRRAGKHIGQGGAPLQSESGQVDFAQFGEPLEQPSSTKNVDFAQFGSLPNGAPKSGAADGSAPQAFADLPPDKAEDRPSDNVTAMPRQRQRSAFDRMPLSKNVQDRRGGREPAMPFPVTPHPQDLSGSALARDAGFDAIPRFAPEPFQDIRTDLPPPDGRTMSQPNSMGTRG